MAAPLTPEEQHEAYVRQLAEAKRVANNAKHARIRAHIAADAAIAAEHEAAKGRMKGGTGWSQRERAYFDERAAGEFNIMLETMTRTNTLCDAFAELVVESALDWTEEKHTFNDETMGRDQAEAVAHLTFDKTVRGATFTKVIKETARDTRDAVRDAVTGNSATAAVQAAAKKAATKAAKKAAKASVIAARATMEGSEAKTTMEGMKAWKKPPAGPPAAGGAVHNMLNGQCGRMRRQLKKSVKDIRAKLQAHGGGDAFGAHIDDETAFRIWNRTLLHRADPTPVQIRDPVGAYTPLTPWAALSDDEEIVSLIFGMHNAGSTAEYELCEALTVSHAPRARLDAACEAVLATVKPAAVSAASRCSDRFKQKMEMRLAWLVHTYMLLDKIRRANPIQRIIIFDEVSLALGQPDLFTRLNGWAAGVPKPSDVPAGIDQIRAATLLGQIAFPLQPTTTYATCGYEQKAALDAVRDAVKDDILEMLVRAGLPDDPAAGPWLAALTTKTTGKMLELRMGSLLW